MAAMALSWSGARGRYRLIHQYLREQTAPDHAAVDRAFAAFDLADRDAYGRLLLAHASVTPVVEAALARGSTLPAWRPRSMLVFADLDALRIAPPRPLSFGPIKSRAAHLGALYVLEGSRLGGKLLSGRVSAGLPVTYLSDGHLPGEWRKFLQRLDEAAQRSEAVWRDDLVDGARQVFKAYLEAAIWPR